MLNQSIHVAAAFLSLLNLECLLLLALAAGLTANAFSRSASSHDRIRKSVLCILRVLHTLAGLVLLRSPLRTTPAPRVEASLALPPHATMHINALKALPACLAQDLPYSNSCIDKSLLGSCCHVKPECYSSKTKLGAVSLQDPWSRHSQRQKVAFSTIEKTLQSADRLATLPGT